MAQYTELSVTATPGKPHTFAAKTAATIKGTGPFTALSVTATPGSIHTFTAKTAAAVDVEALFSLSRHVCPVSVRLSRHIYFSEN